MSSNSIIQGTRSASSSHYLENIDSQQNNIKRIPSQSEGHPAGKVLDERGVEKVKSEDKSKLSESQQEELKRVKEQHISYSNADSSNFLDQYHFLQSNFKEDAIFLTKDLTCIINKNILQKYLCKTFFLKLTCDNSTFCIGTKHIVEFRLPQSFLVDAKDQCQVMFNNLNFVSQNNSNKFIKSYCLVSFDSCNFNNENIIIIAPSVTLKNCTGINNLILDVGDLTINGNTTDTIPYYSSVKKLMLLKHEKLSTISIAKKYFQSDTNTLNKLTLKQCNILPQLKVYSIQNIASINIKECSFNKLRITNSKNISIINVKLKILILDDMQNLIDLTFRDSAVNKIEGEVISSQAVIDIKKCVGLEDISEFSVQTVKIEACEELQKIEVCTKQLQLINCPNLQKNETETFEDLDSFSAKKNDTFFSRFFILNVHNAGKFEDDLREQVIQATKQATKKVSDDQYTLFLTTGNNIILLTNKSKQLNINTKFLIELIQQHSDKIYDILPIDDTTIPEKQRECDIMRDGYVPEDPIMYKTITANGTIFKVYSFTNLMRWILSDNRKIVSFDKEDHEYKDPLKNVFNFNNIFRVNIPYDFLITYLDTIQTIIVNDNTNFSGII